MEVHFTTEMEADVIAVMAKKGGELLPTAVELDEKTGGALRRALAATRFGGEPGQVVDVLGVEGASAPRLLIIGVGDVDKADALAVERWAAHAVRRVSASGAQRLALAPDGLPQAPVAEAGAHAALGARLGAYRFDQYKTKQKPESKPSLAALNIVVEAPAAARARYEKIAPVADGVAFARDLVSEPPNKLFPEAMAARLKRLEEHGVEVTILGEPELAALGMNALLGVGQGSKRETKLVVMEWKGAKSKKARPLALIGKGVTFDTGGISLKPGAAMDEMKGDMAGAAAVAGAMLSLAMRQAKAHVVGLVGLVENMPGGEAMRPGDILTSMSGQTIEVLNTDAEGRLVLADVLWYAQEKHSPAAMVDLATLTGAIITSLGHEYGGLFSNDDDLAAALTQAGAGEGELLWRLPLASGYDKMIDTPNADMKNISGKPAGGSIVGAQFLKRFVKDGVAWAHLDIAGMAWRPGVEDPLSPAWATGYGVRLLNRLVANIYEE